MRNRRAFFVLLLSFVPALAWAEHRVALLIGNSAYKDKTLSVPETNLRALASGLERYGFRCKTVKDLGEAKLKSAIEDFSDSTPVRGTALIYFSGQVLPGSYKGKRGVCLLGTDSKRGRGYSLDLVLENLSEKGGSSRNLVVTKSPEVLDHAVPNHSVELPQGCLLAFSKQDVLLGKLTGSGDLIAAIRSRAASVKSSIPAGVTVSGRGSASISSPDVFVRGRKAGDEWVNARGMVFCWCPPGPFVRGSPEGEPGRYPDEAQQEVVIQEGFWISKYEITLSQWRGSRSRGNSPVHKNCPVNRISQSKDTLAREIRPLNTAERERGRVPRDQEYALPSEEQGEYAARAGTTTTWYFGDDVQLLPEHANFGDRSYYDTGDIFSNAAHRTLDDGDARLAVVGRHAPNAWGLHDVYGNVAEWCDNAVTRGGSWVSVTGNCRSAYRRKRGDRDKQAYVGCRFVIRKARPEGTETKPQAKSKAARKQTR